MKRGKERGGRRRRGRVGSEPLFVITGLLEEVEKVLTRNVLKEKEEVRLGLESAIKSGNIWVSGQCLMNSSLQDGRASGGNGRSGSEGGRSA